MPRRLMIAMLGPGLALLTAPQVSLARTSHILSATTHSRQAAVAWPEGKTGALVEDATVALEHAKAAQTDPPDVYIKAGISHLKAAIRKGRKNNAARAINWASLALRRFEHAPHRSIVRHAL